MEKRKRMQNERGGGRKWNSKEKFICFASWSCNEDNVAMRGA